MEFYGVELMVWSLRYGVYSVEFYSVEFMVWSLRYGVLRYGMEFYGMVLRLTYGMELPFEKFASPRVRRCRVQQKKKTSEPAYYKLALLLCVISFIS